MENKNSGTKYDFYIMHPSELQEENKSLLESCEGATMMYKDLTKAKEIIKDMYEYIKVFYPKADFTIKAEDFLKE